MKFRSETIIEHPVDAVFAAYRDQLADVVPFLDDISEVNVLERTEDGDVVRLHNEWVSNTEIPKMAQGMLNPDDLRWDDYASWDANKKQCSFQIKTRVFRDEVSCTGTTSLVAAGDHTKVVLEGDFTVSIKKIPGVPRLLMGKVLPMVEQFIVKLIQPNLEKTNLAVGKFLDAQG